MNRCRTRKSNESNVSASASGMPDSGAVTTCDGKSAHPSSACLWLPSRTLVLVIDKARAPAARKLSSPVKRSESCILSSAVPLADGTKAPRLRAAGNDLFSIAYNDMFCKITIYK